ncbi:MAG TPA: OmpA family protein [Chitinophagaceae bacterium]|nr:OmpA family protein [Chitinophagaceae bacterium]
MSLFTVLAVRGQGYDINRISHKARILYQRAQDALGQSSDQIAEGFLIRATQEDTAFLDAYAQLGTLQLQNKEYSLAAGNLAHAIRLDSGFAKNLMFSLSKAFAGEGFFRQALVMMDAYLSRSAPDSSQQREALAWEQHYRFALSTLDPAHSFDPVNLGDSINSPMQEYAASLTIDRSTMYFTRLLQGRNEDFYVSQIGPDGKWSLAKNLGPPVNTAYNEGSGHISQDGNILLFAGCDFPGGYGSCDIYYAIRTTQGWTEPRNIGPPINGAYWDTQPSLSSDNQDLYFVSNRPGGSGGSDIYVSHRQADGRWGAPQNLGPNINTPGDESSPFIHADGQTLYFASDGWPGIGGVDLFYSRRNPDGSWSRAVNLGYPINTIDHDGSLFVASDGKTAYLASDRADGKGGLDLYSFTLYPAARPLRTLFVRGYVYDSKSLERLSCEIDLVDLSNGKTLSSVHSDASGNYLVALPVGADYAFHVNRMGYLFYSHHFSLPANSPDKPFYINIGLQPLAVNDSVTLNNIFFDVDRYDLKPESQGELDQIVRLMRQNPGIHIQISGYTDNSGTESHNQELSRHRAEAVVKYLADRGIAADRLSAKGYGATHPVATNDTEQGKALNRRTGLVITAK